MPKNIEDMIVPSGDRRRSIRDIPIPEGRRRSDMARPPMSEPSISTRPGRPAKKLNLIKESLPELVAMPSSPPPPVLLRRERKSHGKAILTTGAIILVAAFIALSLFNGATFSYIPKSAALAFNDETYLAQKTGADGLFYSVVKLSGEKGMSAPAQGESDVSRKASGVIIVYNDASTESQQLVENTRFESPAGKIYRIQKAISIPGKKVVAGVSMPGTLEVTVYADAPGDTYNGPLSDFTVPGFKGSPRYTTIYARSKTPMTGGFVGKEKTVKPEDLARTKNSLQDALKAELWQQVQAEVPADFILFPSLSTYAFEDMPQTSAGAGNDTTVNLRGTLYGIMFKKSDLSSYLSGKKLTVAENERIDIPALDSLTLSFAGTPPADLLPLNQVSFKVSGNVVALWHTDEVALKADLVGRHKADIAGVLANYPTIASASVTVRPFWKTSLPNQTDKIVIKKLSPQ